MLHPSVSNNVGFFQWLVNSNSCKRLKIYATTVDYKNFIYPEVNIVVGSWETREYDRTFENVQLPFVIGENNTKYPSEWFTNNRWLVIAVEIVDGTGSGHLYATCTNEQETNALYTSGYKVTLDGGYRWNGNGSIMELIHFPIPPIIINWAGTLIQGPWLFFNWALLVDLRLFPKFYS